MMLRWLSNITFSVFALGYLPIFLSKIKQAEDPKKLWKERWGSLNMGRFPKEKTRIWLHAVSVGEVKAIEPFFNILVSQNYEVFLSTVTPTGQSLAKKLAGDRAFYFPFDLTGPVRKALRAVKPDLILLAETELWPNFIEGASKLKIPMAVINGRLSKRSFERYQWIQFLMSKVLQRLSFLAMQTEADGERIRSLGAPAEKVLILGNMKFDGKTEKEVPKPEVLKAEYGIAEKKKVWVAGSTHPGEEQKLFNVFMRLRSVFPDLTLVLAPRHIERSAGVQKLAKEFNLKALRLSELETSENEFDILIIDSIGQLKKIYSFADAVFLGGSLIEHGGQNPIEPALYAKPILSGTNVFNFTFVYEELEKAQAVKLVCSEDELFVGIKEFLNQDASSLGFGRRAQETVERLSGASRKTAEKIENFFAQQEAVKIIAAPEETKKQCPVS